MFYDRFVELCKNKGVSRTKACVDCGISRTAWHKWEDGSTPNGATINKFAAYFSVSVGHLLDEETEKAPAESGKGDILDEVDVAFYGEFKELDDEQKATIRDMVAIMRNRRKKQEPPESE